MKIHLEVFFVKLEEENIIYVRKDQDISEKSDNPDAYVAELVAKFALELKIKPEQCIIHSTSWRCAECDLIALTYMVYSDFMDLGDLKPKIIPLKELSIATGDSIDKPHPTHLSEKNIVAHGVRHISFLIKQKRDNYEKSLQPATVDTFAKIDTMLGGSIS